jgi:hypothetical protein
MALGSMSFDSLFNQVAAEVPQSKTSKVKVIAFVAGLTYYLCWFTLFGDCLMLDPERLEYTKGDPAFLLSHLHDHGSPGTRLGAYIKAMCGFVTSLPAKPSAAGARVGAINKLLPLMPPFFVCAATGHEQRNDSAMFEYMNANMALQQPSACVFAGFPPMTYGSVGMGPAAPSLAPLLNGDWGWTLEGVEAMINEVYRVDSASPKELQRGGCMRLALHASFAAQIMHYKAREKAREVPAVTNILLRAVAARLERHSGGSSSSSAMVLTVVGGSAHSTLCAFGAAVRRNFDEANLLLTSRASHEGVERVVGVLGTALEAQRDAAKETTMLKVEVGELRTLLAQQGQMIEQQKRAMEALQKGAAWQQEALAQLLAGQRHLAGGGGGGEGTATAAAAAATLVDAHASALAPSFPVAPPSAPRPLPAALPLMYLPASATTANCHSSSKAKAPAGPAASLTGMLAKVYYGERMAAGGSPPLLSAQHGTLSKQIFLWFGRMATKEERELLLPPLVSQVVDMHAISGDRRLLLTKLHGLVVARLASHFPLGDTSLKSLKTIQLKCSSIDLYKRNLRTLELAVDESTAAFAAFRRGHEAATAPRGSSSSGSGSGSGGGAGGSESVGQVRAAAEANATGGSKKAKS